jgi:hypothetical protein
VTKLIVYFKRHQLIAYFVLTYVFTWALLILFQPLFLEGRKIVAPSFPARLPHDETIQEVP